MAGPLRWVLLVSLVANESADLERQARTIRPLQGKRALDGRPTVDDCEPGVGRLPASTPVEFLERLREIDDPRTPDPEAPPAADR